MLLKQLSKIIFLKATTEQNYINLYVDLCEELFKKFNDKENVEMNFKKLILRKCQKEFYKEKYSDNEEDFSKLSLAVYDETEIQYWKKIWVFGNIKLIGELFTWGYVKDDIALKCFEILTENMEENVDEDWIESLCFLIERVFKFIIK